MPTVYTVAQAAETLSLSPRAVLHRIKHNKIAAEKIGDGRTSAYLIDAAEIDRVLKEDRQQPEAER